MSGDSLKRGFEPEAAMVLFWAAPVLKSLGGLDPKLGVVVLGGPALDAL